MRLKPSQDMWVILILLLFVSAVIFFAGGRRQSQEGMELNPKRTTYSSHRGGLKGLYETLDRLDYPVARQLSPLTNTPADGALFIVSPSMQVNKREWKSLRSWVERGNVLILASGYAEIGDGPKSDSTPVTPSFLTPDAKSFRVVEEERITDDEWGFDEGGCSGGYG